MSKFHGSSPWTTISKALQKAKHRTALTPYFGTGASAMLHLRPLDRLIVDASLANVKCGSVDPSEILKVRDKGVRCFTVGGLHAKIYLTEARVFVGSPNASKYSAKHLIESCLEETSAGVRRDIANWIDSLSLEPLENSQLEYLATKYRTPRFPAGKSALPARRQARFWITNVEGSIDYELSQEHGRWSKKLEAIAGKTSEPFEIIRRTRQPGLMFQMAKAGDEAFVIDRDFKPAHVYAPMRIMDKAFVETRNGIPIHTLAFEDYDPPYISLSRFRAAAKKAKIKLPVSGISTRKVSTATAAVLRSAF